MSVVFEEDIREEVATAVAKRMVTAARTAPKAKGKDTFFAAIVDAETRRTIASHMRTMVETSGAARFFLRDADNLEQADGLVLLGTRIDRLGLHPCGLCGFADCNEKRQHPDHPCSFNTGDLGIAVGSAVSVAMDARVDNRVMFSIGMAARELNLLGNDARIVYGIPLSIGSKDPFFDRKPGK